MFRACFEILCDSRSYCGWPPIHGWVQSQELPSAPRWAGCTGPHTWCPTRPSCLPGYKITGPNIEGLRQPCWRTVGTPRPSEGNPTKEVSGGSGFWISWPEAQTAQGFPPCVSAFRQRCRHRRGFPLRFLYFWAKKFYLFPIKKAQNPARFTARAFCSFIQILTCRMICVFIGFCCYLLYVIFLTLYM